MASQLVAGILVPEPCLLWEMGRERERERGGGRVERRTVHANSVLIIGYMVSPAMSLFVWDSSEPSVCMQQLCSLKTSRGRGGFHVRRYEVRFNQS